MVADGGILAGLNEAQRTAAHAVRGPVAILAGAGTGKTTTITHRIANQVATGTFEARQILAVTFTDKAARQLKERLARLGAEGVEARTFHAAALSQLSRLWERHTGERLPVDPRSQGAPDRLAGGRPAAPLQVPPAQRAGGRDRVGQEPHDRAVALPRVLGPAPAADAGRADARGLRRLRAAEATHRPAGLRGHAGPRRPAVRRASGGGGRGARADRRRHRRRVPGREPPAAGAARAVAGRTRRALRRRGRLPDDLLVHGGVARAPARLPGPLPERHRRAARREPSLLAAGPDGGERAGPAPGWVREGAAGHEAGRAEPHRPCAAGRGRRGRVRRGCVPEPRATEGVSWDRMAVLSRINARSEPYEEAFAAAAIPYQVRDGAFLRRPGPRSVLARLRRVDATVDLVDAVRSVTDELGFDAEASPDSDEEATRQADLGRLRALAAEHAASLGEGATAAGFLAELERRFAADREGRGVQLMTYHRAKGLEFDAVFLPRLLDGELPFRSRRSEADPEEERRLALRRHHARTHAPVPLMAFGRARRAEPVPRRDRGERATGQRRPRVGGRRTASRSGRPSAGRCSTG